MNLNCVASWQYIDFSFNLFNVLKTSEGSKLHSNYLWKTLLVFTCSSDLTPNSYWEQRDLKVEGSSLKTVVTHSQRSTVPQNRKKHACVWQRSCKNVVSQAYWFLVVEPYQNQCLWKKKKPQNPNNPKPQNMYKWLNYSQYRVSLLVLEIYI